MSSLLKLNLGLKGACRSNCRRVSNVVRASLQANSGKRGDFQSGGRRPVTRFPRWILVRAEEEDDTSMVELGSEDAPLPLGPLAMLLVGFSKEELERIRNMMIHELEADMVKLLACDAKMLRMPLREALEQPADLPFIQLFKRKTIILSGFYGDEMKDVIAAYTESGLPDCVWGAVVEKNYNTLVNDLIDDYNDEQKLMDAKKKIDDAE